MTQQALSIILKPDENGHSECHYAFAIWHNQQTGQITVRTEKGFSKFPADSVSSIQLTQTYLEFEGPPEQ